MVVGGHTGLSGHRVFFGEYRVVEGHIGFLESKKCCWRASSVVGGHIVLLGAQRVVGRGT